MSTKLDRIAELAREDPKRQFFSIAHLITPEALEAAFRSLRKAASAGVDGVTYEEYEANAGRNIRQLHKRLKDGTYQAQPLCRYKLKSSSSLVNRCPLDEGDRRGDQTFPMLRELIDMRA